MAYPNLTYPINSNSSLARPYNGADWDWCDNRKEAKATQRAYDFMLEIGLAEEGSNQKIDAHCSFWNKNRTYDTKAEIIDAQQARRLAWATGGSKALGCEIIEEIHNFAVRQNSQAAAALLTAGGRTKDNRQVDSKMWSKVAGWLGDFRYFQGGTYEDGSPIDTCTEEGLAYVYDEESDRLQNKIDDLDQPLPNSLLIGLVGAGVLIIGVILYKVIK